MILNTPFRPQLDVPVAVDNPPGRGTIIDILHEGTHVLFCLDGTSVSLRLPVADVRRVIGATRRDIAGSTVCWDGTTLTVGKEVSQ